MCNAVWYRGASVKMFFLVCALRLKRPSFDGRQISRLPNVVQEDQKNAERISLILVV